MKCPKCGYLGFEQVDRCRNCGYEFSLAKSEPVPDLSLNAQSDELNPVDDLSFLKEPSPTVAPPPAAPDLPLFVRHTTDDAPLITAPSPPRAPLAVRRATPEAPRVRSGPRAQALDLGFELPPVAPASRPAGRAAESTGSGSQIWGMGSGADAATADAGRDAGLGSRGLAVAIDLMILGAVDLSVVYLTMQIAGIGILDLPVLPKLPLFTFLIVQNGGYLVAFTAGGQTLGKMALGIRVVTADEAEPVGVGRAGLRTLLWALLAVPGGLGFLTALFRADHRGLHDRLAGTRVVRASA